jgi:hypothetical protein
MSSIMRWRSGEMLVGSVMGNSCLSEVAKTSILKTELPAQITLSSQLVTARNAARYRVAI